VENAGQNGIIPMMAELNLGTSWIGENRDYSMAERNK